MTGPQSPGSNAPQEGAERVYKSWREGFVVPLLVGVLVFGGIALLPAVIASESPLIDIVFISIFVLIALSLIVKFSYRVRISIFLASVYMLALVELINLGVLGDSLFFMLALVVFSTMLFSPRVGIAAVVAGVLTLIAAGALMLGGSAAPLNPNAMPAKFEDWVTACATLTMFGVVIIVGFRQLEREFSSAQAQIASTLNALREERNNLENRVEERTLQLRRINEVERAVAAVLDVNEILPLAVKYIQNEFGFYYTAIYLMDSTGQWAELKEAMGEAGRVMKEKKHRLNVNGKSLIAQVIRAKSGKIVQDVNLIRQEYPLFPYTRSLIAVPLVVGDTILGALEMHSSKESGFLPQDLDAYQNMANGISISIENSRLYQEARQSIMEMQATQRQYLESAWNALASEKNLNYALGDTELAGVNPLEVPLALRNQIIGQIVTSGASEWTPEQKDLIESIAAQATLALENARLIEQSQFTALQERLTNEIISKIWASPNMDAILQTAVRELGRSLEASEVEIEVSMEGLNDE